MLAEYRERGLFPEFPFGTDLTKEELELRKGLLALEQLIKTKKLHLPRLAEIRKVAIIPQEARKYLERMQLDQPRSVKERLLRRTLVYALASVNAI
jgi:hypothetical protein